MSTIRWCRIAAVSAIFALCSSANAQSIFKEYRPGEWSKIVAGANAEGKVYLYASVSPPTLVQIKAGFEAAYPGIRLEYTRLLGPQVPNTVDQERQSNADGADVVITPEAAWSTERSRQNVFRAPAGPASTAWPNAYVINGVAPILAQEPLVMLYNTNLVKAKITGYADLLKPEYKGKIGIVEPSASILVAFYDWLEQTQGAGFLAKLAAQEPRLYVSAQPITQATAAGEIAVSQFAVHGTAGPLVRQGAPLHIVVPTPSVGTPYVGAVLNNAKRPNAALVFLDFMMSPAGGQTIWAGKGDVASPIGVPGSLDIKSINLLDQSKYPPEVAGAYQVKWVKMFRR